MAMQKWLVEFEVDDCWIEDGFDLTDEIAKSMIENQLDYAYPSETNAKVIKSPDKNIIRKLQGYEC